MTDRRPSLPRFALAAFAWLFFFLPSFAEAQAPAARKVEPTLKPFLWRIEGDTPSFLFGTIHVPDDRVLALHPVVDEALAASDAFYAELELDDATQMEMMPLMMLPEGKTLKGILPEKLYQRAGALLSKKGVPIDAFANFKPWVFYSQLSMIDYLQMMAFKAPMDKALYTRSAEAGKSVGGLEKIEEQVAAFECLTEEETLVMIEATVQGLEEAEKGGPKPIEALVEAYLSGDPATMQKMMSDESGMGAELAKKFFKALLYDRNQTMAGRILAKLKEEPAKVHFFAIGAGHYPGDEGLVALIEKGGHTVTRLTAADAGKVAPQPAGAGQEK